MNTERKGRYIAFFPEYDWSLMGRDLKATRTSANGIQSGTTARLAFESASTSGGKHRGEVPNFGRITAINVTEEAAYQSFFGRPSNAPAGVINNPFGTFPHRGSELPYLQINGQTVMENLVKGIRSFQQSSEKERSHRTVRPGNRHAVVTVKEIGRFRESRLTFSAKQILSGGARNL